MSSCAVNVMNKIISKQKLRTLLLKILANAGTWSECQRKYLAPEKARFNATKLPGCGTGCSQGLHCLRTCRAATYNKPAYDDASKHIAISNKEKMSLNILTFADSNETSVLNVDDKKAWVQISCAVDSGACAHVVPPDVRVLHITGRDGRG